VRSLAGYLVGEAKSFVFAIGLLMLVIGFPLIGKSLVLTSLLLVVSVVLYFYAWAALTLYGEGPSESPTEGPSAGDS